MMMFVVCRVGFGVYGSRFVVVQGSFVVFWIAGVYVCFGCVGWGDLEGQFSGLRGVWNLGWEGRFLCLRGGQFRVRVLCV